ncbi:MAG: hypothetical protein G01um101470_149 [Parcubacteria group bacterium Gr01-1014_70]|nr:MAG: hypothetical protein G01um101470_149 [Parcubacteria group bacterium Gr01-1014_70]
MSYTIRKALVSDSKAIDRELYPHLHNHQSSQEYIRRVITSPDYVLLVVDEGTADTPILVGAATLHVVIQAAGGLKAEIDDLVVLPSKRRAGYASRLFECLEEYAKRRNVRHIFFTSAPWRGEANKFHIAAGYRLRAAAVEDNGTNYYEKKLT